MSEKTIAQVHEANFRTLMRVFEEGNAALLSCKLRATGEEVAVIVGVSHENKEFTLTPFAMFFNGNPYEILEDPTKENTLPLIPLTEDTP
jgi:hypothetical protein